MFVKKREPTKELTAYEIQFAYGIMRMAGLDNWVIKTGKPISEITQEEMEGIYRERDEYVREQYIPRRKKELKDNQQKGE